MQEFRHFDPQKLELLEARIKGNRSQQQPIMIADDSNHSTSTCSRGSPSDDLEVRTCRHSSNNVTVLLNQYSHGDETQTH